MAEACDEILTQLKGFVMEMKQNHLAEFLSFNMNTDRLDEFYWNYMKDAKHSKVWKVLTIIFTLFHGQAAVERGFSVNSELLVENLQKKTLVASRFVYSSVKSNANHFSELSFIPVEDKICEVKCKRKLLNKSIQALSLEADKLATEAEVKHNFTLLAKLLAKFALLCLQSKMLSD